ncbi:complement C1q-like protein 4 [Crassostrea angulata]|uniref:complement C1q-like protein 4 n=1 Tax=Magallana angulata TaxID=2784310 RepID=UPI0022B1E6AD|nr:complement C1q-like protein 4 [Crassostrea angulata]
MSLLFHINPVSGYCKNTTLKLFDDQIQAIQKFVRTIAEDEFCKQENSPVGFHAYMGSTKTYEKGVVWVYDKVVTNTHKAYSATTGKFTTPEQGLYMFSYSTVSDPGKWSHAGLYVNGKIRSWQNSSNGGGKNQWLTSSNTAILLLQEDDVVYVASFHLDATIRGFLSDFGGAKLH